VKVPGLTVERDLGSIPWRATELPGVSWFPLHLGTGAPVDRSRGAGTVLIRMEPGAGYERHRHVGFEEVLVLQGGYRDEFGEHRRGDHVHYDDGSEHAPVALGDPSRPAGEDNPACVLFAVAGGIELLDRRPR